LADSRWSRSKQELVRKTWGRSQPSDFNLNCAQIEGEFAKLDQVMEDASTDKGVNTANVAAVVFFWPAAVGNYMNAGEAEKLVEKRRTHLIGLYKQKGCVAAE